MATIEGVEDSLIGGEDVDQKIIIFFAYVLIFSPQKKIHILKNGIYTVAT